MDLLLFLMIVGVVFAPFVIGELMDRRRDDDWPYSDRTPERKRYDWPSS